jgi:hypothetical protein
MIPQAVATLSDVEPCASIGLVAPFAEKDYVDLKRTACILGSSILTAYRLAETKDRGGRGMLSLVDYRPRARKRILYSSIVRLCDDLRKKFAIDDRRPPLGNSSFRHRDEDLLPFPMKDTIYTAEAMRALGYCDYKPIMRLIEEGRFDSYQLMPGSEWRISRSSFLRFLAATLDRDKLPVTSSARQVSLKTRRSLVHR